MSCESFFSCPDHTSLLALLNRPLQPWRKIREHWKPALSKGKTLLFIYLLVLLIKPDMALELYCCVLWHYEFIESDHVPQTGNGVNTRDTGFMEARYMFKLSRYDVHSSPYYKARTIKIAIQTWIQTAK